MKKYYAVCTSCYDNGRLTANLVDTIEAEEIKKYIERDLMLVAGIHNETFNIRQIQTEENSMEEMILEAQESMEDDCKNCPYNKDYKCRNQCYEEAEIYNPNLPQL